MRTILILIGLSIGTLSAQAQQVEKQLFTTTSPNGLQESCVIQRLPGVNYKKSDEENEQQYCSIDLYNGRYAICAKTWSTSPGSIIFDVSQTGLSMSQAEDSCRNLNWDKHKNTQPIQGADKIAKFKNTMNDDGTSGTYSQSSLVYYHVSRYLETLIDVPTAVYRTIDKDQHLNRVSLRAASQGATTSRIKAGWNSLIRAEKNPTTYKQTDELFTEDRRQIYGILLRGKGQRYGAEFNGVQSKWGLQQNIEFTETAPFLALRSAGNINSAIAEGLKQASKTSKMRQEMGSQVSDVQMMFWMIDITEITLLDYIFSQQDRIGNIDYRWYWVYVKNDDLKDKREKGLENSRGDDLARNRVDFSAVAPPEKIAEYQPVLIQKTQVNDNDAGTRKYFNEDTKKILNTPYVNFTAKAKMLEKINHYPARLYSRFVQLNNDIQSGGMVYQWMAEIGMKSSYLKSTQYFSAQALKILKEKCESGELIFDLDAKEFLLTGTTQPKSMNCVTGEYQ